MKLKIADPPKLPFTNEIYILWNSQETDFKELSKSESIYRLSAPSHTGFIISLNAIN